MALPDEEGIRTSCFTTHSILWDGVESAMGAGISPVPRDKGKGTMKRCFAIGATLMLALTGFPASGQTDEQIRDYLTNDECYWPDFQRNPSFKICPPADIARATGGRGGPGWIVTQNWIPRQFGNAGQPGLTVTYSCNVWHDGSVSSYGNVPCPRRVSFVVVRNPDMATKGEQTHGYGYDLFFHFSIPTAQRDNEAGGSGYHPRMYKHEVLAIVDAAFKTFGVSGGNHGLECTNPNFFLNDEDDWELFALREGRGRETWDGWRRDFVYQPEFYVRDPENHSGERCNPRFRTP